MNGREDDCFGGEALFQAIDKDFVGFFGVLLVFEGRFPREGVFVEPLKEGDVHEGSFISELRSVEMEIGKAWDDELSAMVDELLALKSFWEGFRGSNDFAIFDMKVAVMDGDEFIKAFVICDVAFDDVFHFLSFLIEKAP